MDGWMLSLILIIFPICLLASRTFFRLAYSRKQQLFARGQYTSLLWDWLVFRGIARLMGGNLRCILVELPNSLVAPLRNPSASLLLDADPGAGGIPPRGVEEADETARVFQFLSTCFCCPVLHGSVHPEAAGFFTLGTLGECGLPFHPAASIHA